MALGRKTGGRRKGTPNKVKMPNVKKMLEERLQADAEAEVAKPTMLEIMMGFARDESHPPEFRLKAAIGAAPYLHAKKSEEPAENGVQPLNEVRIVVVSPPDRSESDRAKLNESFASSGLPYHVNDEGATVRNEAPPGEPEEAKPKETDPVADARSRLDRLRGVH
jgi:hypothetical protein